MGVCAPIAKMFLNSNRREPSPLTKFMKKTMMFFISEEPPKEDASARRLAVLRNTVNAII